MPGQNGKKLEKNLETNSKNTEALKEIQNHMENIQKVIGERSGQNGKSLETSPKNTEALSDQEIAKEIDNHLENILKVIYERLDIWKLLDWTKINPERKTLTYEKPFYKMGSYNQETCFNVETKKIPLLNITFEDEREGVLIANLINFVRGELKWEKLFWEAENGIVMVKTKKSVGEWTKFLTIEKIDALYPTLKDPKNREIFINYLNGELLTSEQKTNIKTTDFSVEEINDREVVIPVKNKSNTSVYHIHVTRMGKKSMTASYQWKKTELNAFTLKEFKTSLANFLDDCFKDDREIIWKKAEEAYEILDK